MRTAVSYARFSSDRQHESSIEAQRDAIAAYAKARDIQIVREYADRGISGRTDQRPEFQQLVSDLKKHPVDLVLVHKLDRFARDRYDAAIYSRAIRQRGARLIAVAQDYGDGPESVILEALLQGMAEYYSLNLATEVIKGIKVKIRKGLHACGPAPFGYRLESGRLIVNPLEAHYIALAYQSATTGMPRRKELLREMEQAGIRSRRGNLMKSSDISRMLRNPVYKGTFQASAGDENVRIDDNHPAIVSPELWEEANHNMEKRVTAGHREAAAPYLLTGICICAQCGRHLTGDQTSVRDKNGKIHRYRRYRCRTAGCKKPTIDADYLENLVIEYIRKLLNPEIRAGLTQALLDYSKGRTKALRSRAPANRQEISKLEQQQRAILANLESGVLSPQTLATLDGRLVEIRAQIDTLRAITELPSDEVAEDAILRYFDDAAAIDPKADPAAAAQMIRRFVSQVIVGEKDIEIRATFQEWLEAHFPGIAPKLGERSNLDSF